MTITPTQKYIIGGLAGLIVLLGVLWFVLRKDLSNQIVIPYIAHQKPQIDPHLPNAVPLSDKLDEVLFDGLFNISANPSGVVYEDGLGELIEITPTNEVVIRLKAGKKWHSSYAVKVDDDDVTISEGSEALFSAQDLNFTLRRIEQLGSLSPDYILVSQALKTFAFDGPDNNNEIRFRFKDDRIWTEADIKEILSFKIIPANSSLTAQNYYNGSGPYLATTPQAEVTNYFRNPAGSAALERLNLKPFVDNSTFTTELKNTNINVLLSTPFGSLSPILQDPEDFFTKSNISTTFFTVLFNTQRLNREQRQELRRLIDNRAILNRFFKVGSEQQRHITDYKGNNDNYADYLNYSVFPSSTYYVEEEIVVPLRDETPANLAVLPDSIRLVACINYGNREEYSELLEIFNDPAISKGKIRALAVDNEEIVKGNYDALLLSIDGYKSTFLFDLYNIFLRQPDLSRQQINLAIETDPSGKTRPAAKSLQAGNNFCRLDALAPGADQPDIQKFLEYTYGFMYANYIGDKQVFAQLVADSESKLALGEWLFSLPSLAYFSTQFDDRSIDLYGVASQLSTIEKWQERRDQ